MSNKSLFESLKENAMDGAISGAVATGLSSLMYSIPIMADINFLGVDLPVGAAIFGVVGVSVAASDFLSYEILANLPVIQNYVPMESKILPVVVSGLTTYGLFYSTISKDTSLSNSVIIGAGGAAIGRYLGSIWNNSQI